MTTEQLLKEIKALEAKKQIFSRKGISIDTLLLLLRITETELMPLITDLLNQGLIQLQPAPSNQQRSKLLGTIILTQADSIK